MLGVAQESGLYAKPGGLPSFLGRGLPDQVVRGHFPVMLISWNPQPSRLPPEGTLSGQPRCNPPLGWEKCHAPSRPIET